MESKKTKNWLQWGFFVLLFVAFTACGDIGGSGQCGGGSETGTCLRIENISPGDEKNKNSSNVDAFFSVCTATSTLEVMTDHVAEITVSNRRIPGSIIVLSDVSDITLRDYTITYSNNDCPVGVVACPDLGTLRVAPGQTQIVKADQTITFTLPFVPLRIKQDYVRSGGPEFLPQTEA